MDRWESFAVGEEIIKYIKKNKITNYAEFMLYCRKNNEKWFKKLCDTPNMRKYFRN
ncbi:MAG: hypothetical protein IKY90_09545 [Oscillospiraceae bacterium]|nr:hypothetical protein [Oscillospiraceae bacterium]